MEIEIGHCPISTCVIIYLIDNQVFINLYGANCAIFLSKTATSRTPSQGR
jgi:hypothetical protein